MQVDLCVYIEIKPHRESSWKRLACGGSAGADRCSASCHRYTFGPGLFVAWISSGVLLVAGVLKSLAFKGIMDENKSR